MVKVKKYSSGRKGGAPTTGKKATNTAPNGQSTNDKNNKPKDAPQTAPAATQPVAATAPPSKDEDRLVNQIWYKLIVPVASGIWSLLKGALNFLLSKKYPIAHYVALVLVIIFMIGGLGFLVSKKKKKKTKDKRSLVERLIGNRASAFFQQMGTPVTDPRPIITGRCDNLNFIDKGNGVCVSSQLPPPIEWIIDSDTIPELKELPLDIQRRLSNDGAKFKVTIPWKSDGLVYTPDCDKAMFSDGTPAYLLKDGGSICKKLELDKTIELSKYRYIPEYSKYTGLSNFVEADPNSSTIEKVSPGEVCSIQAAKDLGIFDNTRFYKPGYDTIRSYNKTIDHNGAFSHKLCSENTVKEEATLLCPLVKNAGIGFTSKPGSKCVTSECPTGFTEDKSDPMICNKPLKDKVVQLNSRNDEQYDDWYTIPNYHLGNKYGNSNDVYLAPCPAGSVPYYSTDIVDNSTAGWGATDQIDVCIDKSLYFGGKYRDTSDYCPVAMVKRLGSSTRDLLEDYVRISKSDNVPASVKSKIQTVVQSISADTFSNLQLLTDEMDAACSKFNLEGENTVKEPGQLKDDMSRLEQAYNICELLSKNEEGFVAKFAGDVGSLIKLRKDATKYSCQQLFGIPLEERSNPLATNENATRIDKPPLTFPDVEKIQFEQYISEYEKEIKAKEAPLPPITSNTEKKQFIDAISKGLGGYVGVLIVIIIILLIYNYRRCIYQFLVCTIYNSIVTKIPVLKLKVSSSPVCDQNYNCLNPVPVAPSASEDSSIPIASPTASPAAAIKSKADKSKKPSPNVNNKPGFGDKLKAFGKKILNNNSIATKLQERKQLKNIQKELRASTGSRALA